MRIHHAITGDDIDPQSVADAIHLSESKYCSVGAMVRQSGAEITTTYSILPRETVNHKAVVTLVSPAVAA